MINNPWSDLEKFKMKRANNTSKFDIYWAKDAQGNYCLLLKIKKAFLNFENIITKNLETKFSKDDLVIIHKDTTNSDIFKIFCDDIIVTVEKTISEELISSEIYNRIIQWKDLLQGNMKKILSTEEQIGLFGELLTLKQVILENEKNIDSWRGPEKDIQDFLCSNCAIEVKSCLSSKNKIITISSKNQLETEKKHLFIIQYCLTIQKEGINLNELVLSTLNLLYSDIDKVSFFKKLLELGYSFDEKNYHSFIVDSENYFEVTENFPKLNSKDLDQRIIEVKYKIDLNRCDEFKITKSKVLGEL
ncbi:MAG: PD-(D/E)XK motif protein [Fusobacteriaceae bacterium]